MADTPIGSTPAGQPCAPCASPPSNCVTDLAEIQQQVCDLTTNYLATLQELQEIRRAYVGQGKEIKDLISANDALNKRLSDLGGASCARLGVSATPNAIIVCENGVQKVMPAPTNDGNVLISSGGKWSASTQTLGLNRQASGAALVNNVGAGTYNFTLPGFPAFTQQCWVTIYFSINSITTDPSNPAVHGSSQAIFNGIGGPHVGPSSDDSTYEFTFPVSGAAANIVIQSTGAIGSLAVTAILRFYDYR